MSKKNPSRTVRDVSVYFGYFVYKKRTTKTEMKYSVVFYI